MVSHDSKFVLAKLRDLGATKNPDAARAALEACLLLPVESVDEMSGAIQTWIAQDVYGDLKEMGAKISVRLLQAGFKGSALQIAKASLGGLA